MRPSRRRSLTSYLSWRWDTRNWWHPSMRHNHQSNQTAPPSQWFATYEGNVSQVFTATSSHTSRRLWCVSWVCEAEVTLKEYTNLPQHKLHTKKGKFWLHPMRMWQNVKYWFCFKEMYECRHPYIYHVCYKSRSQKLYSHMYPYICLYTDIHLKNKIQL